MARRKGMTTNLNLVSFIDLFSTLIIFLLVTSVWEQLAAVPVSLGSTETHPIQMPSSPSDIKKVNADLKVIIDKAGVVLFDSGKSTRIAREALLGSDFSQLEAFVSQSRQKYADKRDVVLSLADDAIYSDLVTVMDKFLAEDFDQLIVMGAEM